MTIGKVWSIISNSVLGNPNGKHCHWCAHGESEEGEYFCKNPHSKFYDEGRIRTWDGEECADECGLFQLEEWYADDDNVREYFEPDVAQAWFDAAEKPKETA